LWWVTFTANANQSNASVTRARVASTEVCACHRGKKLIFNNVEIDFYHRGNEFFTTLDTDFTTVEIDFYRVEIAYLENCARA